MDKLPAAPGGHRGPPHKRRSELLNGGYIRGGEVMSANSESTESVHDKVRAGYAAIALRTTEAASQGGCCSGVSCCGSSGDDAAMLARSVGYDEADLAELPEGANMGLSCGNPTALASLKAGEIVLDLGSGGGFDCFLAGRKVGATGRVIGVDMTAEMLAKARGNVATYREHSGLDNVEFRLGEIEHLPVADNSVDVVISNCVINLSPNKPQVWREIARVLRPGGRVAVSDLALLRPLPEAVLSDVEALVGCVAGAELVENVGRFVRDAGLADVQLVPKPQYIETMTSFRDPMYQKIVAALPDGMGPADYITSLNVSARKPE